MKELLETLIEKLPVLKDSHAPTCEAYALLRDIAKREVARLFSEKDLKPKLFGPFGNLVFPYIKMGAVDSLDLFGLDELIIFSFYWLNRNRYKKALDIGGNIGLHSLVLSKSGYDVKVYEPDPTHFKLLTENLNYNHVKSVKAVNAAVSTKSGTAEFVRVLGNTTSSHIAGSKNPYGELETFTVKVDDIKGLLKDAQLVKMDVEGHEKELILATEAKDWKELDMILEVGSRENAAAIYEHLKKIGVNCFAQKRGWKQVASVDDVPIKHYEGSLFISMKSEMPWS